MSALLALSLENNRAEGDFLLSHCLVVQERPGERPRALATEQLPWDALKPQTIPLLRQNFPVGSRILSNVTLTQSPSQAGAAQRAVRIASRIAIYLINNPQLQGEELNDIPVRELVREVEPEPLVASFTIAATVTSQGLTGWLRPARSPIQYRWCDLQKKLFLSPTDTTWLSIAPTLQGNTPLIPAGSFFRTTRPIDFKVNVGYHMKSDLANLPKIAVLVGAFSQQAGLVLPPKALWQHTLLAEQAPQRHFPAGERYYPLKPGERLSTLIALLPEAMVTPKLTSALGQALSQSAPLAPLLTASHGAFLTESALAPFRQLQSHILPLAHAHWSSQGALELAGNGTALKAGVWVTMDAAHIGVGPEGIHLP